MLIFNMLMVIEFDRSLPMVLMRTLDEVMPHFRAIYSAYELTDQQWRVLRVLWQEGVSNLNTLSERTLISSPSMVGVIDRLESRNIVTRTRDPSSRRSVQIQVTEKGKALYKEILPKVERLYERMMQGISDEQWQQVQETLETINQHTKNLSTER
jgi:homoprotocatechuate degradation regulator HpaR